MARPLSSGFRMDITCADACHRYITHAERVFRRPDGTPTRQANNIKLALRDLIASYGTIAAIALHSSHLKALRSNWVNLSLTRSTINARTRLIVAGWSWLHEMGAVPESTVASLLSVRPLRRGYAAEGTGVCGVSPQLVLATLPHMAPGVADMCRFMLLTGCRVGEAREARSDELYRSGNLWALRPRWHKCARYGHGRSIVLPTEARDLISPMLNRKFMFGPGDGERPYHRDVVTVAIYRACDRAGVERWSPGRIRHTAATAVHQAHGLEATRAVLGHSSDRVTRTYVHGSDERASAAAVGALAILLKESA